MLKLFAVLSSTLKLLHKYFVYNKDTSAKLFFPCRGIEYLISIIVKL